MSSDGLLLVIIRAQREGTAALVRKSVRYQYQTARPHTPVIDSMTVQSSILQLLISSSLLTTNYWAAGSVPAPHTETVTFSLLPLDLPAGPDTEIDVLHVGRDQTADIVVQLVKNVCVSRAPWDPPDIIIAWRRHFSSETKSLQLLQTYRRKIIKILNFLYLSLVNVFVMIISWYFLIWWLH